MKWTGAALAVLAVVGLVASTSESLSCAKMEYSGGTMVDCESMAIFQPRMREHAAGYDEEAEVSIPLPPWVIGVLGAMYHGNCKTTEIAEGQWTVCSDGFSMLEREGATAAWALGLHPGEKQLRNARVLNGPKKESHAGAVVDCGRFPCADYVSGPDKPEIQAHVDSLSSTDRARLHNKIRAWERQEIERDLERARAENTALHARLEEMAAYEAELELAESLAQVAPRPMK